MDTSSRRGAAGKQAVMAIAAVVILALAILLFVRGRGSSTAGKTLTLCCESCGKVFPDQPFGELPSPCPECGKKTLRRALQCYKCGHIFAEPQLKMDPGALEPEPVACPKCEATDVGAPRAKGEAPKKGDSRIPGRR